MRCSADVLQNKSIPYKYLHKYLWAFHTVCYANIFLKRANMRAYQLSGFSVWLSDKSLPSLYILNTVNAVFMLQKVRWPSVNDNPHHSSLSKMPFRCQLRQRWVADDGVHQREIKAYDRAFPNVHNPCHSITILQICCSDFFLIQEKQQLCKGIYSLFASTQIRFVMRVNEHTKHTLMVLIIRPV